MSEQLPPGYELDKVVAAKIMGWEFLDVGYLGMEGEGGATPRQIELADWLDKPEIVAITDHSVGDYFIDVASDMIRFTDDFQPSTDIAAAMQVWEKVASGRGWGVDTDGEKWWSGNQTDEMVPRRGWTWEDRMAQESGESAAHAICLAALEVAGT